MAIGQLGDQILAFKMSTDTFKEYMIWPILIFGWRELNCGGGADSKGNGTGSHAHKMGGCNPILSNIAKFLNV